MAAFLFTSISGYLTLLLLGFTALLPYLVRRRGQAAGGVMKMGLHYCIGYAIFVVVLLHMLVSMQAGMARGANLTGLNLASVAFLLIMIQVVLGITLKDRGGRARPLKMLHFATMAGIVLLTCMHVALNNMLLRWLANS